MTRSGDRRSFIKTVIAGATAASLARLHPVLAANSAVTPAQKLSDNLWVLVSGGANVVACRDPAGIALVDGGPAASSRDLLKQVSDTTGASKVHTLFNTHWHPEQTGSNLRLGGDGAKIIAHENTRLWLGYANPVPPQNMPYGPLPPKARPTATFFYDSVQTQFGDEPVQYGYLGQAHTDGDIYVYFTKSNVLMTGDAVQPGRLPLLDWRCDGWLGGMQDAQRTLLRVANDTTKIVPGSGPVMTKADLQAELDTVTKIRDQMTKLLKSGMGPADMIAGKAMQEFQPKLAGDPDKFIYTAYRGMWAHARELGGIV